jgi:pimeloyl-ACP methyl ester carboxylesterase
MRWPTAHTSIEYHRWAVRSFWRTDGLRFMSAMSEPITTDVLHIHGVLDPMVLSASCSGSGGYVSGSYRFAALQTGHFPQEEAPADVSALIIEWLNEHTRS